MRRRPLRRLSALLGLRGLRRSWPIAFLACLAVFASLVAAPGLAGWLGGALALLMLAIALIDRRQFIIPDELNAAAFLLALADARIGRGALLEDTASAVIRGAVLAATFLALRILYRRLRGRDGLGLGDVKLAGVAGAWLGWFTIPISIEIAALGALAAHIVARRSQGLTLSATARLPFGLFFAPPIWLCWLLETTLGLG